jgi:hypothetical protein
LFTVAAVGCGVVSGGGLFVTGGGGPAFGSYGCWLGGYGDGVAAVYREGWRVGRTGGSSSQAVSKAKALKSDSESESFISGFDDIVSVVIQCRPGDNR